jgi:hypothetical protein
MRCSTCGTQNEPDSRFCGGCGARLGGTLAPTQKVVPDPVVQQAPIGGRPPRPQVVPTSRQDNYTPPPEFQRSVPPQQPSLPPQPVASLAPQIRPSNPSLPPQAAPSRQVPARPSTPQTVQRRPQTPVSGNHTPSPSTPGSGRRAVSAGSSRARNSQVDRAVPRRRWGLIIVVLLLDLGLAGAGVYLLTEGLADTPTPTPSTGSEATKTGGAEPARPQAPPPKEPLAATPTAATQPVAATPASSPSPPGAAASPPPEDPAPPGSAASSARTPKPKPKPKPKGPVDPYPEGSSAPPSGPEVGPPPPPPSASNQ